MKLLWRPQQRSRDFWKCSYSLYQSTIYIRALPSHYKSYTAMKALSWPPNAFSRHLKAHLWPLKSLLWLLHHCHCLYKHSHGLYERALSQNLQALLLPFQTLWGLQDHFECLLKYGVLNDGSLILVICKTMDRLQSLKQWYYDRLSLLDPKLKSDIT
jgi:hypothetical protein